MSVAASLFSRELLEGRQPAADERVHRCDFCAVYRTNNEKLLEVHRLSVHWRRINFRSEYFTTEDGSQRWRGVPPNRDVRMTPFLRTRTEVETDGGDVVRSLGQAATPPPTPACPPKEEATEADCIDIAVVSSPPHKESEEGCASSVEILSVISPPPVAIIGEVARPANGRPQPRSQRRRQPPAMSSEQLRHILETAQNVKSEGDKTTRQAQSEAEQSRSVNATVEYVRAAGGTDDSVAATSAECNLLIKKFMTRPSSEENRSALAHIQMDQKGTADVPRPRRSRWDDEVLVVRDTKAAAETAVTLTQPIHDMQLEDELDETSSSAVDAVSSRPLPTIFACPIFCPVNECEFQCNEDLEMRHHFLFEHTLMGRREPYVCPESVCRVDSEFKRQKTFDAASLWEHVMNAHPLNEYFDEVTPVVVWDSAGFETACVEPPTVNNCFVCHQTFGNGSVVAHEMSCHSGSIDGWAVVDCAICDATVVTISTSLVEHLSLPGHTFIGSGEYLCPRSKNCPFTDADPEKVVEHAADAHQPVIQVRAECTVVCRLTHYTWQSWRLCQYAHAVERYRCVHCRHQMSPFDVAAHKPRHCGAATRRRKRDNR